MALSVTVAGWGTLSVAAFLVVLFVSLAQSPNFYAAAVYASRSNACTMVLCNFSIFLSFLAGRALQVVFFGQLRSIEVEHLHDRLWINVTEMLLALTIFREQFDATFVILFISLLLLKSFHWLGADRVDLMEQSQTITALFHIRLVTLFIILMIVDAFLLVYASESILVDGPNVMIMFASEYTIQYTNLCATLAKYAINVIDMRSEEPWDNKSIYVFYIDIATEFFKLITYATFFCLIFTFYGLPLHTLRDVYITFRSLALKIRDLTRFRAATRNMDERYPDATEADLSRTDRVCIICREDMEPVAQAVGDRARQSQVNRDKPKILGCGHIFHFGCLRSWLERQQSCPTCRAPVVGNEANNQNSSRNAASSPAVPHPRDHHQRQGYLQQQPNGESGHNNPDIGSNSNNNSLNVNDQFQAGSSNTPSSSIPRPSTSYPRMDPRAIAGSRWSSSVTDLNRGNALSQRGPHTPMMENRLNGVPSVPSHFGRSGMRLPNLDTGLPFLNDQHQYPHHHSHQYTRPHGDDDDTRNPLKNFILPSYPTHLSTLKNTYNNNRLSTSPSPNDYFQNSQQHQQAQPPNAPKLEHAPSPSMPARPSLFPSPLLSEGQIKMLSTLTKASIEQRVRILAEAQETVSTVVDRLTAVLSSIPQDNAVAVAAAAGGGGGEGGGEGSTSPVGTSPQSPVYRTKSSTTGTYTTVPQNDNNTETRKDIGEKNTSSSSLSPATAMTTATATTTIAEGSPRTNQVGEKEREEEIRTLHEELAKLGGGGDKDNEKESLGARDKGKKSMEGINAT